MEKEIVAAMAAAEGSEEAPVSVRRVSSCFVRPSSPAPSAPEEAMFLSAGDIMWRWFYYNQRVLFFDLPLINTTELQQKQSEEEEEEDKGEEEEEEGGDRNENNNHEEKRKKEEVAMMTFEEAVRRLKAGLAMALVEFYPWAGRLFEQEEDGRLSLLCNHAGVQFIEATVNLPFSSLALHGFQYRDFFKDLAPMGDALCWTGPELPLLSIQVTRFQDDGGLAIGTGRSHVVSNGHSFWHFMRSWGECSRGLPISMKPLHMRNQLGPHNLILPCRTDHPISLSRKSVTCGGSFDLGQSTDQQVAQRCFHFTAAMIQRLKDMAMAEGHHTGPPFSSFQVLCAHLWKHVTMAHTLIKDQPKSRVLVIANYRNRLQPPLPPSYFGNVIFWDFAKSPSASLQKDSLGVIARQIQEMITSMKDEAFRKALGNLEVLDPHVVLLKDMEPNMVLLSVASSPKFPVYEVDFGWGKPVCVRPACIRKCGDILLFPGGKEHGSVDVCIGLENDVMEKLEHDQSFLSFS